MKTDENAMLVCDLLAERKAEDIVVIDTTNLENPVEYLVFATCKDYVHANELAVFVVEEIGKKGVKLVTREGFGHAEWIVLDFDKFFVHISTADIRDKYNIEKLFTDGRNVKKYKKVIKERKEEEEEILKNQRKQEKKNIKAQKKVEGAEEKTSKKKKKSDK